MFFATGIFRLLRMGNRGAEVCAEEVLLTLVLLAALGGGMVTTRTISVSRASEGE